MQVQTTAHVLIAADIERVFDASTDCENLPQFFTGYQTIPAIVSARTEDGQPLREGSRRIVTNSDGTSVEEIILTLKRPHCQEYQLIKGLKPPFSWLVRSAAGRWRYEEDDAGVKVTWRFEFEIRNILAYFIFQQVVKSPFQVAQQQCLENIKTFLETG